MCLKKSRPAIVHYIYEYQYQLAKVLAPPEANNIFEYYYISSRELPICLDHEQHLL